MTDARKPAETAAPVAAPVAAPGSAAPFDPFAIARPSDITDEHVQYFRDNPDQLSIISEREDVSVWKYVLTFFAAVALVGGSKYLATEYSDTVDRFVNSVFVDLIFEMGAALIGSVATVLFINLQDKRQFERNLRLRLALERRVQAAATGDAA